MFLTRGIKVSFPKLIEIRTRSSKLRREIMKLATQKRWSRGIQNIKRHRRRRWETEKRRVCQVPVRPDLEVIFGGLENQINRWLFVGRRQRGRIVIKRPKSVAGKPMSLKSTKVSKLQRVSFTDGGWYKKKKERFIKSEGWDGKPEESKQEFLLWWSWEAYTEPKWIKIRIKTAWFTHYLVI